MTVIRPQMDAMPQTERMTGAAVTPADRLAEVIETAMSETVRRYRTRMAEIERREMEKVLDAAE